MPFTEIEIINDWLGDSAAPFEIARIMLGFNAAEYFLGRDWIDGHRTRPGGMSEGTLLVLPIASTGLRLHDIRGANGLEKVIKRLQGGDTSIASELAAAHLLCNELSSSTLAFEIPVTVGSGPRVPDFLVTVDDVPVYVEVTAPNAAETTKLAQRLISDLATRIAALPAPLSIEALLLREPFESEIEQVLAAATIAASKYPAEHRVDIHGLAVIVANRTPPGLVEPFDHGLNLGPMIGSATSQLENGLPTRTVSVRLPVADTRAVRVLETEAAQLPRDYSNLVLIDTTHVPGALSTWEPLLLRRLQPTINTRIGGIALLSWGIHLHDPGLALKSSTRFVSNSYARRPLPPVIGERVVSANGATLR
jgi:hypothetical protein